MGPFRYIVIIGSLLVAFQNCSQEGFNLSNLRNAPGGEDISSEREQLPPPTGEPLDPRTEKISDVIVNSLQDTSALMNTVTSPSNFTLECMRRLSACTPNNRFDFYSGHLLDELYDASGNLLYKDSRVTDGFDADGRPCSTYGRPGEESCVFKPEIRWYTVCRDFTNCVDPEMIFAVRMEYNGPNGLENFMSTEYQADNATNRFQDTCNGSNRLACERIDFTQSCNAVNGDCMQEWDSSMRDLRAEVDCNNGYSRYTGQLRCMRTTVTENISNGTRTRRWMGTSYQTTATNCDADFGEENNACVQKIFRGTGCGECPFGTEQNGLSMACKLNGGLGSFKHLISGNYTSPRNTNQYTNYGAQCRSVSFTTGTANLEWMIDLR